MLDHIALQEAGPTLDLSGAQSGQMVFDVAAVDLAEVLEESWAMVAAEAPMRWAALPAAIDRSQRACGGRKASSGPCSGRSSPLSK